MKIQFFKYHGTGNDFVLIDNRRRNLNGDEVDFFKKICHRRFGIGADGVILLNKHPDYDFEMDYFNSDGNRSSMCGNGGRCIVQFASDLGIIRDRARFLAVDGEHVGHLSPGGRVNLQMTVPHGFEELSLSDFWIHTGSPHFVRFLGEPVDTVDVVKEGREIRHSQPWGEEGTNVNFVQMTGTGDEKEASVRTYERGVEDETWSCGTGVTAVAEVIARIYGVTPVTVNLETPGGSLTVHVDVGKAPWLEGAARFVFEGRIDIFTPRLGYSVDSGGSLRPFGK